MKKQARKSSGDWSSLDLEGDDRYHCCWCSWKAAPVCHTHTRAWAGGVSVSCPHGQFTLHGSQRMCRGWAGLSRLGGWKAQWSFQDVCPAATPHLLHGTRALRGMGWAKRALAWAGWAGAPRSHTLTQCWVMEVRNWCGPGSLCPLGESGALGRKASRLCSQMGRGSPSGFQWGQEHQRDRTESIAWSFLQVRAVKAELALLEVGGGGGRLHSPPGEGCSALRLSCLATEHRWLEGNSAGWGRQLTLLPLQLWASHFSFWACFLVWKMGLMIVCIGEPFYTADGTASMENSMEIPLEEGMATHFNILAWRIPWMEEPGGLQSMGFQRVRHDWATKYMKVPLRTKNTTLQSHSWAYI